MVKDYSYKFSEIKDISNKISNFLGDKSISIPVTIYEIDELANVFNQTNCIESNLTKILINNELWKNYIASVPTERRLLLLPQCLKNSKKCLADYDELGLICNDCGECSLPSIEDKAMRNGYNVLIAEGSSAVLKLIKENSIDCIIGVSCFSALEKSFSYLLENGVPGLAIPLLNDGCIDTTVDQNWLDYILSLKSQNQRIPLSITKTRNQVERLFKHEEISKQFNTKYSAVSIALDWLSSSGKRLRPLLASLIYKSLRPESEIFNEDFRMALYGIECFHKASLIHDDIEDNDSIRDNKLTLHCQYDTSIAINSGDALIGEGYRLLNKLNIDNSQKSEIIKIAAQGHCELSYGQGEELFWGWSPTPLSLEKIVEIFKLKTSPAFNVAIQIGAILGNADDELRKSLELYSSELGIIYQIEDDLEDEVINMSRPSIISVLVYNQLSLEEKETIQMEWKAGLLKSEVINERYIANAKKEALLIQNEHRTKVIEIIRKINNVDIRRVLFTLIEKIVNK